MGGAAGGRLAGAVSAAGGLGMIGMGSAGTAAGLHTELDLLGEPAWPFGIGLVHWVTAGAPELLEVALAARPSLLCVSFGDEWSWVRVAHAHGIPAATQIATVDAARQAVDAGVDILVARGLEGGGHGALALGTLPLLAEVLDAVDVPVLAGGGIASARALAAVLAAGAAGAWVGTALAACTESLTPPPARAQLVAAASDTTTVTREFDVASGYPWPATLPERVLMDDEGHATPVNAGQGVGAVTAVRSASEVLRELSGGAEALLRRWC
ncbi:MAG TPA: nitronate monooxygenase [Mycobacterium sp.]|nr:nitronate monooxygenase [Mycobacterium sp.]